MKRFTPAILSVFAISASQAAPPVAGRDYSHITSLDAANVLVEKGELFTILLFPAEFGGEDIPENVVYVPRGIPEIKDQTTDTLIRYFKEGLIDNLTVSPEYKSKSLVPSRIIIKADHSSKAGSFEPTIEVW